MGSTATANTCLDLHIGVGMHYHEPVSHKPSTQSRISKIKLHMFRRAMLMNACYGQGEACCRDIHSEAREASELSCNIKIMDLFPQHKGFADSSIPEKAKANASSEEGDMLVKDSVDVTHSQHPAEQSRSQLTMFYNGTIKVFDVSADEAGVIMMMAADNSLQQTSALSSASSATWDAVPLRGRLTKNSSSAAVSSMGPNQRSDAEPPIAKKLSLQRFLQKRKDRIKRRVPYPTSAK